MTTPFVAKLNSLKKKPLCFCVRYNGQLKITRLRWLRTYSDIVFARVPVVQGAKQPSTNRNKLNLPDEGVWLKAPPMKNRITEIADMVILLEDMFVELL